MSDSHIQRPGEMHEVDRAFYNLTVTQRDGAWREVEQLKEQLAAKDAELSDLRDDVKRHMQIATEAQGELAESRAAALEEALSQMLDDMGADGFCVCPAAKEQAIAAMGGRDDT
jgi:hypothetical protein